MRIMIFAGYYHPHKGGYEKNIHELSKRLVARGHRVTVVTCWNGKHERLDGVRIVRLPFWNLLGGTYPVPKPSWTLDSLLFRTRKPDMVITQTRFFTTSMLGWLYCKLHRGVPLIHVERGTRHSVVASPVVNTLSKMVDHLVGGIIVRKAVMDVGVSQAACAFIGHIGGKRVGDKVRVIHNGIVIPNIERREHDGTRVAFVGRLIQAKGVQDLIRAAARCNDGARMGLQLIVIGDGNYRGVLEETGVKQLGDKIRFTGELGYGDVMQELARCDLFVNPSYSEGLPTSVMEAMAMGLPVVATDVGGTGEIIDNGRTGVLVKAQCIRELMQAIMTTLGDRGMATEMGERAREAVRERFDWEGITDEWETLLEEVVNG